MEITENSVFPFSALMQEPGNQLFQFFYEKAGNSPKFTKFIKILEIFINLVKKSYFLPEAEKSGNTQSES